MLAKLYIGLHKVVSLVAYCIIAPFLFFMTVIKLMTYMGGKKKLLLKTS